MSLQQTLAQIAQLKKELDSLQPLSAEAEEKLWKKFRLEWNYNSNHMEGNTLTYGETVLLLINGKTTGDHEVREYEEMKAHDLAIHEVREWARDKDRDLTEVDIRQLNKTILKEPFWKEAITDDGQPTRRLIKIGEYKEYPNSVRLQTGEIFKYASPTDTPRLMKELVEWYRGAVDLHPLVLAAELHYRFIRIHPFDDGNGRVARLLVNFVLMKNNYPPSVIKSSDKNGYLTALQKADAGNLEAFIEYMAEQLVWSLEISIKAATGESISEEGDLEKRLYQLNQKVSGQIDMVEKSDYHIQRILKSVYLPLIKRTDDRIEKMKFLFEGKAYSTFKEPEEIEGKIALLGTTIASFEVLNNYFLNIANTKGDSYHSYKVGIWLYRYKKEEMGFSVETGFKIYFHRYDYEIKVTVSKPYAGGTIMRSFAELLLKLGPENDAAKNFEVIDVEIGKWKYLEKLSDEFLTKKAEEISHATLDFIEKRIVSPNKKK